MNVRRPDQEVNGVADHDRLEAVDVRRDAIVAAALELLDETGFERLSLRRLAAQLGMHAPGLYWYFENKQALIDLMAKAILEPGLAGIGALAEGQTWETWLVELACTTRRALLARRDGARVVASALMVRTNALTPVIEQGLTILEAEGFESGSALGAVWMLIRYATGSALDEQASPIREHSGSPEDTHPPLGPPPIDAERWPRTARALARVFDGKPRDRERLFRWSATMIVTGMSGTRTTRR